MSIDYVYNIIILFVKINLKKSIFIQFIHFG